MQTKPANYCKNESVKVVFNAVSSLDCRGWVDTIVNLAAEIVDGKRDALPDDYADIFSVEIFTRPSGSRYAVVNFA